MEDKNLWLEQSKNLNADLLSFLKGLTVITEPALPYITSLLKHIEKQND